MAIDVLCESNIEILELILRNAEHCFGHLIVRPRLLFVPLLEVYHHIVGELAGEELGRGWPRGSEGGLAGLASYPVEHVGTAAGGRVGVACTEASLPPARYILPRETRFLGPMR